MSGTVNILFVAPAIARAQRLGARTDDLLPTLGLTAADLADPDARLDFTASVRLLNELALRTGEPDFGLRVIRDLPAGHFDIEYLVRTSATLGAGYRRAAKFVKMLSTHGHLDVQITSGEMRLVNRPPAVGSRHLHDFTMYLLLVLGRRATGVFLRPIRVEFIHSEPENRGLLDESFACPLLFARPANCVVFPATHDALALPGHDEQLAGLVERHAQAKISSLTDPTALADRVRKSLYHVIQRGDLTLEKVARLVGLSERSLQRELRRESTSYRDLVDEVRRDIAVAHMKEGRLPIGAIALLLDFSDVSAFHRSFRRWTGQAPSVFRASARGDER